MIRKSTCIAEETNIIGKITHLHNWSCSESYNAKTLKHDFTLKCYGSEHVTHPQNGTHASNIVHRTTHSALFLGEQTKFKYVKFEIQDLAPFSHLTLISVTFDVFSERKSANKNNIRKSTKFCFHDLS